MNSGLMPNGSRAQNNSLFDGVPQREREHAPQPGQRVGAPVVVGGDDRLAVAVGGETRRRDSAAQLVAQLQVVVDLAVEHQHVAVGRSGGPQRSGWWQCAMSMIDSRLNPSTTTLASSCPGAGLVRPAVAHQVRGAGHRVDQTPGGDVERTGRSDQGQQSAHRASMPNAARGRAAATYSPGAVASCTRGVVYAA